MIGSPGRLDNPGGIKGSRKMQTTTDTPRIYVACLAAYNSGKLHGEWIDASQTAEDIHAILPINTPEEVRYAETYSGHQWVAVQRIARTL